MSSCSSHSSTRDTLGLWSSGSGNSVAVIEGAQLMVDWDASRENAWREGRHDHRALEKIPPGAQVSNALML